MNMKKFLAIAVSCATMAMSVSAFADTAEYDVDTTSVAVAIEADSKIPTADEQLTVVVVPASFGAETAATAENIYYINQAEAGTEFEAIIADMGVKGELTEGETYEVRIGGETLSEVITLSFTVDGGEPTYVIGDADGSGKVDVLDASAIVDHLLNVKLITGDNLLAADADASGKVDVLDASAIVDYLLNVITELGGK